LLELGFVIVISIHCKDTQDLCATKKQKESFFFENVNDHLSWPGPRNLTVPALSAGPKHAQTKGKHAQTKGKHAQSKVWHFP